MIMLTIVLDDELEQIIQSALHRQTITVEEFVKKAIYQYPEVGQATAGKEGKDSLVGIFDLSDPLLSEKSEEILHTIFAKVIE